MASFPSERVRLPRRKEGFSCQRDPILEALTQLNGFLSGFPDAVRQVTLGSRVTLSPPTRRPGVFLGTPVREQEDRLSEPEGDTTDRELGCQKFNSRTFRTNAEPKDLQRL